MVGREDFGTPQRGKSETGDLGKDTGKKPVCIGQGGRGARTGEGAVADGGCVDAGWGKGVGGHQEGRCRKKSRRAWVKQLLPKIR